MGWFNDEAPGCEGFLVAVELRGAHWVEIRYPDDRERAVTTLQVACDCGWRSPRFDAPLGARWHPFHVGGAESVEERSRALWAAHVAEVPLPGAATHPTCVPYPATEWDVAQKSRRYRLEGEALAPDGSRAWCAITVNVDRSPKGRIYVSVNGGWRPFRVGGAESVGA